MRRAGPFLRSDGVVTAETLTVSNGAIDFPSCDFIVPSNTTLPHTRKLECTLSEAKFSAEGYGAWSEAHRAISAITETVQRVIETIQSR